MASLIIFCYLSTWFSNNFTNDNISSSRSKPYNSDSEDKGGETFVLLAFVTDVDQDVEEGMDGIEHMSDFYFLL